MTRSVGLREALYAPLKILAVVQALAPSGVEAAGLLEGTGLSVRDVSSAHARTSIEQFLQVCRNAARLSEDPAWGALVGLQLHLTAYGMYGYALACAQSLRQATELAVRYHRLATPVMGIQVVEDASAAAWVLPGREEAGLPDVDERLFGSLLEMQLALTATLTRDVMGAWCVPMLARLALQRPRHGEALARALGCTVVFDQPRTELHYPLAWLDRAPQFANPITAAQVSATCERLLEEHKWGFGLTRLVYQELMRTPGHFPGIAELAQALCLNPRTLRRRLEQEGTSYSQLLDSVRHALAVDYLSTSLLEVDDIAAALGFSEAAGFRHAFKRWTGKTPGQFRSH
jgi:AraC-like DNA-binding protein